MEISRESHDALWLVATLVLAIVLAPAGLLMGVWFGFRARRAGRTRTAVLFFSIAAVALVIMIYVGLFGLGLGVSGSGSGLRHGSPTP